MRWMLTVVILVLCGPLFGAMPSGGNTIPSIYVFRPEVSGECRNMTDSLRNRIRDAVITELVRSGRWQHTEHLPTMPVKADPPLSFLPAILNPHQVDYWAVPSIVILSITPQSNDTVACRMVLRLLLRDSDTGATANFAIATAYARSPREQALSAESLILEAAQDAVRKAVKTLNRYPQPRARITGKSGAGDETIWILDNTARNLQPGMEMAVLRNHRVVAYMRLIDTRTDRAQGVALIGKPAIGDDARFMIRGFPFESRSLKSGIQSIFPLKQWQWEEDWGAMP